jgi:hypothetical protein
MTESSAQIKALIVCLGTNYLVATVKHIFITDSRIFYLGNICRSPMGEAVLKDIANKRGLDIVADSCGTAGYHVGESPDDRYVLSSLEDLLHLSYSYPGQ